MLGGRVIGQGTYGCAVTPPLLCKGRARNERKENQNVRVGKLTLNTDAATELYISKALRKIPLWKNYFVLPELTDCNPVQSSQPVDWSECDVTGKVDTKQLKQVISEFGGRSFSSLGQTNLRATRFDFFRFFRHLLEAGALLTFNGIVHYDLHRANILVDSANVPRLLDFGMSFVAGELKEEVLNERWKQYDPKYDSEVPEVTVITGIRNQLSLKSVIHECLYKKPIFKEIELVLGVSRADNEILLTRFFEKSKAFQNSDWVKFWKLYWTGFDSFSLGAILLNVLKTQLSWPEFINSEQWKTKGAVVEDILRSMLHPSPSERFDCVEALSVYDPMNVVLKDSGAWLEARRAQRT